MSKIVGIDLGTTNSAVAILEGGEAKIITNSNGGRTTPSIVGFTDKERLIGTIAKNQQTTNPENTIFSIKRFMGRRHKEVKSEEKLVPYKVVGNDDDPVSVQIKNKIYSPPEISAMILQELKKDAEAYLGHEVTAAVITVPAYFNDAQRKATQEAGIIAGFDVKRVLPEPTAAALAYGMDKKKTGKIVVFDLGGGTFDVSILDVGDGIYETLSINGDSHLGGDDYDNVLIHFVADEFKKKEGIDLRQDPLAHQRLKESCERAKCELSKSMEATINLPFITADAKGPKHLQQSITRSKFEHIIEHLNTRLRGPCEKALQDAKLSAAEIDEIILVGGSTRMPSVQAICEQIFKKTPNKSVNPDEAVAIGAAIQAGILSGDLHDILVLDVTPLSLGVETMGNVMTVMIPRNTTIPTSKKEVYSTASDNQTEVSIHVLQGERPMSIDNRSLGKFNLTGIPLARRGMPQIEVTFDVDTNGILRVTAKDKATNKEQSIKIEGSSGLSEAEVERMKKEAEDNLEFDNKKKELIDIRNRADATVHSAEDTIKEHGSILDSSEITDIESSVNSLKEALQTDDANAIKLNTDKLLQSLQAVGKKVYENLAKNKDVNEVPVA